MVTLDFRLSSTPPYSDIILPTATAMKRRHEYFRICNLFIHRCLRRSIRQGSEKRLGNLQKPSRRKFSEVCVGHLGKETDIVTLPIQHDSAAELAQPLDVKDWKKANAT